MLFRIQHSLYQGVDATALDDDGHTPQQVAVEEEFEVNSDWLAS